DTWLRVGLLWGIFLPLGACWSIDGRRCIGKPKSETYFSAATVIILLQITLLWMIAGWAKFAEPLWVNGEAIYYATQLDSLATRWTPLLRANFEWTQWLTWAISFSEVLSPLLLFVVPLLIGVWFRTVAVLLLAIIYSLLAVFLDLRLDSYIHVVFVLLFVPRPVWTLLCGAGRPTADRLRQELNLVRQGKGKFRRLGSVDCGRSKSAALLVGLLLSVYPQLNKVIDQTAVPYRAEIQKISNALGFAVGYDFLVPGPSRTEKFWFFLGTLKNGSTVDAFRGSPAALTVGRDPVSMRPGVHWLRVFPDFYARLYSPDLRKRFIRVLCNRWKQKYPVGPMANLKTIRFRIIEDVSALPGGVAIKPIVTGKGILHKCR
ncbi:MAG: putative membrane protein YphA (DoxX/SURF4 family), partial [Gammaproteobacteria bacterium]